jgi:cytochrome c
MAATFARPYPHRVAMPHEQAGVDQVNAAEMVNFCMIVPMNDEPLPWDSIELAALTAYVEHLQEGFQPSAGSAANPCNPCGAANPCNP